MKGGLEGDTAASAVETLHFTLEVLKATQRPSKGQQMAFNSQSNDAKPLKLKETEPNEAA